MEEEYPSENHLMIESLKKKGFIKSKIVARTMKYLDRADFAGFLPYEDTYYF